MRALRILTTFAVLTLILAAPTTAAPPWTLVWSDEFNGVANSGIDPDLWLYDIGTQYPGGPAQWGTGEVEQMTSSNANVYHDGLGHLAIRALHTGSDPVNGWTSGRIETHQVFAPPANGELAIEAAIQQPNVTGAAAAGYWPAFWLLGAPFRGDYNNWPAIGEIDVMEDVNGLDSEFATLHCGTASGGPCNEVTGLSSGRRSCSGCQAGFHVYRVEIDSSTRPQQIRWYLDGVNFFRVVSTAVDAATWQQAINHPFFVLLDVAIGGGFPEAFGGGPTISTASGAAMLVDYVRVYQSTGRETRADFDGDGRTDISIWRPGGGAWYAIRSSDGTATATTWGSGDAPYNDLPVPGDYDGDGRADVAVWRPDSGTWYVLRSSDGGAITTQWGAGYAPHNDVPVPADYDGDGRTDFAVWRTSTGVWYILRSSDGVMVSRQWGAGYAPYNDVPVPADYDGDGLADLAVWRPATGSWFIVRSSDHSVRTVQWGLGDSPYHDIAVPADFDGDGITDVAVWRPGTGTWYVIRSSDGGRFAVSFGAGYTPYNDIPVPGDYDGDGRADLAVWRPSTGVWYLLRSSNGAADSAGWGVGSGPYFDIPVPTTGVR